MLNFSPRNAISLRPYQADAVENMRECIRAGNRRILLVAGTGAGKTVIAAHLLQQASDKGSYAIFIVDRVALVDQTSDVLDEYGIAHGIVQGINDRWMPRENVQVCSAQTLARRSLPREPSLIIVDEAHCQYKATLDFMARYPDAAKIGLTATPFTKGMGQHWDDVVNVIPTRQLINDGFLIPPKIYIAKSPDDADFGLNSSGEFSDASAGAAGVQIVGDVVLEWISKTNAHFGGPAKTIVFSPTVEHGRELCAAFGAAGYNFQQISYLDRSDTERAEKIGEFRRADSAIHGLVSCGVLTKGFDVPDVRVGISCKPYRKSLSSHMQEFGRVMRTCEGKQMAIWLDHSGNIERFGADMFDIWESGVGDLDHSSKRDSTPRKRDQKDREKLVCPECSGALLGVTCLCCGWEKPARSGIVNVVGEMHEYKPKSTVMKPRAGLTAKCLQRPRDVWNAALAFTSANTRKGEDDARKWAYALFFGIYPGARLPSGWYDAPVTEVPDPGALALVNREAHKFRSGSNVRKRKVK